MDAFATFRFFGFCGFFFFFFFFEEEENWFCKMD